MTFKATITCDGLGCHCQKEMDANHPSDAEVEYYNDDSGWQMDEDGSDYCPTCWTKIDTERGEDQPEFNQY
jgi:hypothetical protein